MNQSTWINGFNEKIRLKPFEQFSILLCDLDNCISEQRDLLGSILFGDHLNPQNWHAYVSFATKAFPERKLQLQRLVNKALEILDEKINGDNFYYAALHVMSARLKRFVSSFHPCALNDDIAYNIDCLIH